MSNNGGNNMKKLKALLSILLIIIIALEGSGCMKYNSKGFVSYLENKYPNDKFEFVDFEGGTLFGGDRFRNGRCNSKNIPDYKIYVTYDTYEKKYTDNYLDMKYAHQTDDAINNVFNTAFQNEEFCFVTARENFYSTTKSSCFDNDISFIDYKQKRGIPLYAFVSNYSNKSHDEIVKDLEQEIIKEGLYCDTIEIYVVDNYDSDLNNNDSLQNDIVVNNKYADHLLATMSNNLGFDGIEWENK